MTTVYHIYTKDFLINENHCGNVICEKCFLGNGKIIMMVMHNPSVITERARRICMDSWNLKYQQ